MPVEMTGEKDISKKFSSNFIKTFVLVLILKIINGHLVEFLNDNYFKLSATVEDAAKKDGFIILSVIVAPIIETLLFQFGLNEILVKLKIKNYFLLLIVPSGLFALSHHYNWLYIIYTFFGGLLLNWFYLYAKVNGKYAFWWVVLLHSLFNLYAHLINIE
jgi:uncharacterized protein